MTVDPWEAYFWPAPDEHVMHNLANLRDPAQLRAFDYAATRLRAEQLVNHPDLVDRTYDAAHVRAIHGHLFQDVYDWAGEYRNVNMVKASLGGANAFANFNGEIDTYLDDVASIVDAAHWPGLNRLEFAEQSASVFAHLNQAHPFREGNGRTSKVFMQHVADRSAFELHYDLVSPDIWNALSEQSRPPPGRYEPNPAPLVPMFTAMAADRARPAPSSPPAPPDLRGTSYPKPPRDATHQHPTQDPQQGPKARGRDEHGRDDDGPSR